MPNPPPVPHKPRTPFAYSASATAPVHLDIHIPLILLGLEHGKLTEDLAALAAGAERHERRLEAIHQVLVGVLNESGLSLMLWDTPSLPEKLTGAETDEERVAIEQKREIWRNSEEKKRNSAAEKRMWVLRATPRADEEELVGMYDGWRVGDGLLTPKEAALAYEKRAWTLPFTLQRYSLVLRDRSGWEAEVQVVMNALQRINSLVHPEMGRLFAVVAAERCHPHIAFSHSSSVAWNEYAVTNLFLLMTAFEREIGVLGTPEWMVGYRPLTSFLVKREVKRMRRERRNMWKDFTQEMVDDRRKTEEGRLRRQTRWNRKVWIWKGDIEAEDNVAHRRDELLGEEGKAWWERVYEMVEEGEAADLVKDIAKRTTGGKGARVALGLSILPEHGEDNKDTGDFGQSASIEDANENPGDRRPGHKRQPTQLSLPPSPPPPNLFPSVSFISFPIPLRSPAASPLLAYIDLLSHILLLASEVSPKGVISFIESARKDGRRAQETPLQGLVRLAHSIEVQEEKQDVLKMEVERYLHEQESWSDVLGDKKDDPLGAVERSVEKKYEEGRRGVVGRTNDKGLYARAGQNKDVDEKEEESETFRHRNGIFLRYLERYEYADGFLVPDKMKVLSLLEAEENARKRASDKEQKGGGGENGCSDRVEGEE